MLLLEIANLVVNINMTNTGSKSLLTTINNQQSTINSLGSNHLGFRKVVKSLTFLFITFSVLSFSIPYNKDIIPDKSSTNEVQSKNTIPASFNFTTMIVLQQ